MKGITIHAQKTFTLGQNLVNVFSLMQVSFYLPEKYFPSEEWIQAWKENRPFPLEESGKAAAAHAWIYQTWALLTEAGIKTSLISELPTTGLVLALSGTLDESFRSSQLSSDFFLVDIVADGLPHPAAHFHLVQNRAHAHRLPRSQFIPHWPQPALIPRAENRKMLFEKISFFGDPNNLAAELFSFSWQQRLKKELALEFEIKRADRPLAELAVGDEEQEATAHRGGVYKDILDDSSTGATQLFAPTVELCKGSNQWHDYSNVDAVIAIRDFSRSRQLHKPATKLYNAWLAGVPFIGGNDSAYRSDGRPGIDYLVAQSPKQVLEHLRKLKEDTVFRTHLIQNGIESGKKLCRSATLERWKSLIQETLPTLAFQWQKKSPSQRACYLLAQRAVCWIDRKLR